MTVDDEALWCDPPGDARRRWPDRLAGCLDQPGRWRRVWTTYSSLSASRAVTYLRRGKSRHGCPVVEPTRWEFSSGLTQTPGEWGVWARYLGPGE